MTYVFQLEVEIADGQDVTPALTKVLRSMAEHLDSLRQPGQDPPIRLTVLDLGWRSA